MLAEAGNRPELLSPVGPTGDIGAQVIFAMREEMALTLEDVVMRRTGIGQLGVPSRETLDSVSRLMATELGWSEDRREREIASLTPWYHTREAA
jgi:glycerol-3-phosphate dehydrogenase